MGARNRDAKNLGARGGGGKVGKGTCREAKKPRRGEDGRNVVGEEAWREKEADQDAERETQKRLGGRKRGGVVRATSVVPFDFRHFVLAPTGQPFSVESAVRETWSHCQDDVLSLEC